MNLKKFQFDFKLIQFSLLGLFIIASYGFARPVTDSLFVAHHGAQNFPLVYLLSPFVTALAMIVYNYFNTKHSLIYLLGCAGIISILVMIFCLCLYKIKMPGSVYMLYIWREVYMVLMIEIFWSLADTLFSIKSARKSYGFVLAISSFGGFSNLLVGLIAKKYGTQNALFGVIPCLLTCTFLAWVFSKNLNVKPNLHLQSEHNSKKTFGIQGLSVILASKYLLPLMFLVGIVQISISLIDLQFNTLLQATYSDMDTRTEIIGKIHTLDNLIAALLQFFSGYILKFLGINGVFVGIPIVLGIALSGFIILPHFLMAAVLKVISKCFDYSIFRSSKEMLYIPLSHIEKTQGKALIDILVYRAAKSSAALLMIFLFAFGLTSFSMHIVLFLMLIWILLAVTIVKRYENVIIASHCENL